MTGNPKVVHAVTVAESIPLMQGQLGYLKQCGFEVHLISTAGEELTEIGKEEGVVGHPVPMVREISPVKDLISFVRLIKLYARLKPDISNVGTPKAGLLGGLAALVTRVPVRIYSLRGLRLETTTGVKRILLLWMETIACLCAHRVLCDSRSLRDRAIELGIVRASKTIVLREGSSNGVDVRKYERTPALESMIQETRERLGLSDTDKVIGCVGRLSIEKGIVELVEAYRIVKQRIPDAKLLLVGKYREGDPIPHETFEYMRTDPDIVMTGHVKNPEVYYYCMDVLAFPTHREGFGNVSIEAAAAGRPVVTTCATGSVDTIVPGVTGVLVPVRDADALALALIDLLLDPGKAKAFGTAGKQRVRQHFHAEDIWETIHRMYRSLLQATRKWKGLNEDPPRIRWKN